MELRTEIERADVDAFLDHYRSTGASSRQYTLAWAWFLVLSAVLAALAFVRHGVSLSFLLWSGFFVAWAFLGKRYLLFVARHITARSLAKQDLSAHLGAQKLSVASEGLRCDSKTASSTVSWAGIRKVEDGPAHSFIYLSDLSAFIVPHRSVNSEELSAFLAEIRRRATAAQQSAVAIEPQRQ